MVDQPVEVVTLVEAADADQNDIGRLFTVPPGVAVVPVHELEMGIGEGDHTVQKGLRLGGHAVHVQGGPDHQAISLAHLLQKRSHFVLMEAHPGGRHPAFEAADTVVDFLFLEEDRLHLRPRLAGALQKCLHQDVGHPLLHVRTPVHREYLHLHPPCRIVYPCIIFMIMMYRVKLNPMAFPRMTGAEWISRP